MHTSILSKILRAAGIVAVCILLTFPILWMVIASFKSNLEITNPKNLLSFHPILDNYINVFAVQDFLPFMANSLIVGLASTALAAILAVPAAYAMTRFHMNKSSQAVIFARIMPGIALLVPWYYIFSLFELVGTYWVLILSHMFLSVPLILGLMIPFFEGIPVDLEESGMVDGLSRFSAFLRLCLPLAMPGLGTASLLAFVFSWNNFLFALVLSGQNTKTLPVAIFNFVAYADIDWGGLMAASVVITAPVIVLALLFQRFLVGGLTMGAVKG